MTVQRPVLVLGAGINGASVVRELVLNRVPVWLVDRDDIASGATSKPSRLIHGGLRYLEYGEFRLVREALHERERLLRLAPHYVRRLEFAVPLQHRTGGWQAAVLRFLGSHRALPKTRGLWLVRTGLWLYDRYVNDAAVPRHRVVRVGDPEVPRVNSQQYRWMCVYSDAQMWYPERYTLALLEDAREAARQQQVEFRVLTYHHAQRRSNQVELTDLKCPAAPTVHLEPAAIVNATGAWGDATLSQLSVPSRQLFGGTKGSHFLTLNPELHAALNRAAVYAETGDGRFVFIVPYANASLVGTTDEPFTGDPRQATASAAELDYLLELVAEVFPDVKLSRNDILCHYSGVRPLPYAEQTAPAAVTRDHRVEVHEQGEMPVFTLIGGKLTTSRLLAEQTCDLILQRLEQPRLGDTRERMIPGGEDYPPDHDGVESICRELAQTHGLDPCQVRHIWELWGTRTARILAALDADDRREAEGTDLPTAYLRWAIRHEWVRSVEDLIERRLLLVLRQRVTAGTVRALIRLLVEEGVLAEDQADRAFTDCRQQLQSRYG